jgi:hypothetical protein
MTDPDPGEPKRTDLDPQQYLKATEEKSRLEFILEWYGPADLDP